MRIIYIIISVILMLLNASCRDAQQQKQQQKRVKEKNSDMKTLGLIGGTSWHSTIDYYRYINRMVNDTFGNNTNPPLIIYNLNQHRVFELQKNNDWEGIAEMLTNAGKSLIAGGAEGVLFCANTPHKVFHQVEKKLSVPVIHIADGAAHAVQKDGLQKVGLIGTKYTMEGDFIPGRMQKHFNIEVLVPGKKEVRNRLHRIIHEELTMGIFKDTTKQYVLDRIKSLEKQGAQGIILGCTEFPLIIKQNDLDIPVYNTTYLHALAAVRFILGKE